MINVWIVEDQKLIREGLIALLSLEEDLAIAGDSEHGQVALQQLSQKLPEELPDVALLDMRMPVMDGVATAQALQRQYPSVKVLVLTTFDDDALIAQAMAAGAKGYLLKDTPSEELAVAIRSVAKDYGHFGPGILQKVIKAQPFSQAGVGQVQPHQTAASQAPSNQVPFNQASSNQASSNEPNHAASAVEALTPREREVFEWIGRGASNKEIAAQLYLSEGTVKNHVTNVLGRLGVRDRTQAAILAQSLDTSHR